MTALKQNSWLNKVPITKYLLNPNFDGIIRPPKYLRGAESFNVASAAVNYKNLSEWPSAEEIGFDEAQFKAYQAALTQEFVVIQGPPGTGKTYLGEFSLEKYRLIDMLYANPARTVIIEFYSRTPNPRNAHGRRK